MKIKYLCFLVILFFAACSMMNRKQFYEKLGDEHLRVIVKMPISEYVELNDNAYENLVYEKSGQRAVKILQVYLAEKGVIYDEKSFKSYCDENFSKQKFKMISEFEREDYGYAVSEFEIISPGSYFNQDTKKTDDVPGE